MGLFSKPKAPKPPDLVAANESQVALNRGAATDVMNQNRYGQVGPEGSSNQWVTDPATGKVTNVTNMGARPEAMYNALMDNSTANLGSFQDRYWGGAGAAPAGMGVTGSFSGGGGYGAGGYYGADSGGIPGGIYADDARTGVGGVGGGIQRDLDYSSLGEMPKVDEAARQQVQDALYKQQSQYLDPEFDRAGSALTNRLSNQGLVPGTRAYDAAQRNQGDAKQRAYESARLAAITGGGAEQQRLLEMGLALRGQGKSEIDTQGGFHNAAQGQRAGQLLTDIGQQRSLQGTMAGVNAQLAAAGMNAGAARDRLGLDTRAQEFNELMGMGRGAGSFLPQFNTGQGNMQPYGTGNLPGAMQNQYSDALAQFQANKGNSMLPGIGTIAGSLLGGPAGGAIGGFLGGMLPWGKGGGTPGMTAPGGYGDLY